MSAQDERRLYLLAFDHRASFQKDLLGISGEPDEDEEARIGALKGLVYAGFQQAIAVGAPRDACGLLVDEHFGAGIARSARAAGFTLAMPVEESGRQEFEFEFGDEFGEHIEAFAPTFAKVLVRYNPDGDGPLNSRQAARLARLSGWLRDRHRELLLELLVPATEDQLGEVGGDQDAYDRRLRPALMVRAIAQLQGAGVEPSIWKIEGLDDRADCELTVAQARSGGRSDVHCIVLGRGADTARVVAWLELAAPVPGYIGFAIGRTIWEEALREHLAGRLDAAAASARIANEYRRMIDLYAAASAGRPGA